MAFKRYKKAAPGRRAGECSYTPEDMKRVSWCIDKGIKIAVTPDREAFGTDNWKVEIKLNKGDYKRDPKTYNHENAMKKLYEYYKYYYDKNIQKSE